MVPSWVIAFVCTTNTCESFRVVFFRFGQQGFTTLTAHQNFPLRTGVFYCLHQNVLHGRFHGFAGLEALGGFSLHVSRLCHLLPCFSQFLSVYIFGIYLVAGSPGFTF